MYSYVTRVLYFSRSDQVTYQVSFESGTSSVHDGIFFLDCE